MAYQSPIGGRLKLACADGRLCGAESEAPTTKGQGGGASLSYLVVLRMQPSPPRDSAKSCSCTQRRPNRHSGALAT